ncbi:hypothetical protein OKA04_19495 [Luteolibacter flavescens]|uniref:SGNH hydrolase-type esterase domain-containing protein n=1 Tax=Luteolibacter flavescens TaxID=1859460 RepID=A0ABT3FTM4_9BACT|nr:hypothetical protein [Luteolibacter flavescens]MCW1886933.1 hypothetical protein [Luteolibacter flavescens]
MRKKFWICHQVILLLRATLWTMMFRSDFRYALPCLVAFTAMAPANPIDVGQVMGFTPGIRGAVELVFQSEVGKYYQVQISSDLATWDNEGYSVKGTGGQISVLARTRGLPNAYYRLRDDGDVGNVAPVGPPGPAGSDATVTASNLLSALQALNAVQAGQVRDAIRAADVLDPASGARLLNTPHALAKSITGAPLRIATIGDSMTTGINLGPLMAKRGFIGLTVEASLATGTVTDVRNDFQSWVNGEYQRFAPGSSGEFVPNGRLGPGGYTQGNKAAIIYIARPGAGTFRLQSKTSTGTISVLDGMIDASKDGSGNPVSVPTGVVKEYDLATSNYPSFRLMVDGVVGGDVDVICGAVFPTIGGGVTEIRTLFASRGGLEITDSLKTRPEILAPIWRWLAPDLVFSLWADEGPNWQSGGNWRTYYDRLKSAHADCDFVQVSRNPASGEDQLVADQVTAQREWAAEAGECFIDTNALFGSGFAAANAMGVMADVVHLNTEGVIRRNHHIWSILPLGDVHLGAAGAGGIFQASAEPTATPAWIFDNPLSLSKGLRIQDSPFTNHLDFWNIESLSKVMTFKREGATLFSLSGAQDGTAGFYPGFNGTYLGNPSLRWRIFGTSASQSIVTKTTTYQPGHNDYTMLGDASGGSFSFMLPAAGATGVPGRIYVFKKIDPSSNAVIIDGAGSETIDGSPTISLGGQWDRAQIQSDGTAWFRID